MRLVVSERSLIILAYIFLSVSPVVGEMVRVALLCILAVWLLIKIRSYKAYGFVSLWFFIVLVLSSIFNDLIALTNSGSLTASFVYIPFCFLSGYLISQRFEFQHFFNAYEKLMYPLASIVLISYCLLFFFPGLIVYFFEYEYYGFSSKTIFFLNVLMLDDNILFRNSGFASEPALYQLLLNLALWWRLKSQNQIDFAVLLYVVSIFTTSSTMGYLLMGVVFVCQFGQKQRLQYHIMFIIFFIILIFVLTPHVQQKFHGTSNIADRFLPTINAFHLSFFHPLGLGSVRYNQLYESLNIGAWDSYSQIVLRYGFLSLFLILFLISRLFIRQVALALILFISFLSQSIWFFPIISCVYFWKGSVTEDV